MEKQLEQACEFLEVNIDDVKSKVRKPFLVKVRVMIARYFYNKGLKHVHTGSLINRDHSSISHYMRIFESKYVTALHQFPSKERLDFTKRYNELYEFLNQQN